MKQNAFFLIAVAAVPLLFVGCRSVPENVTISPIIKMKKPQHPDGLELVRDDGQKTTFKQLPKAAQNTLGRFCIYGTSMFACYNSPIEECVKGINQQLEIISQSTDFDITVVSQEGSASATIFLNEETPIINLCKFLALSAGEYLWLSDEGRLYMFFYSPQYGYNHPDDLGPGTFIKFTEEQIP